MTDSQHSQKPAADDLPEEICPVCKMPLSQDICCPE
jgi:hypothetical protein